MATFGNLSDRLAETFKNLRTKGKLSASDVDGTVREIRRALLDADVSLDVVKQFTGPRARARAQRRGQQGAEPGAAGRADRQRGARRASSAAQQRRLQFAKNPPTVIMLAGLQGAGKTTLAGKLAKWLVKDGHTPDARRGRPPAPERRQPAAGRRRPGRRAGLRARAGQRRRRPGEGRQGRGEAGRARPARRRHHRHRRPSRRRRRDDEAGREHPQGRRTPTRCSSSSTR